MRVFLVNLFMSIVFTCTFNVYGQDETDNAKDTAESKNEHTTEGNGNTADDFEQKAIGGFARLRRLFGASDEEIEQYRKEAKEAFLNSPSNIPENIRISQGISMLEELIPELEGLSSSWESIDSPILFSKLTTSIARYHKFPDDRMKELTKVIETIIDLGTKHTLESFSGITNHYCRNLVLKYQSLRYELSALVDDRAEVSQIRNDILANNPNANTRKMDKFLSCVDETHKRADKEFTKLFSLLTNSLQKVVNSVDKLQSIDNEQERNEKIDHMIGHALLLGPGSRIGRTSLRITKRNCYARFDVESVREIHQELVGANTND